MLTAGTSAHADSPTTECSTTIEVPYATAAAEVMQNIRATFYLPERHLYAHSLSDRRPDFMWGNGVMFSALVGATRHGPNAYRPMLDDFFDAIDAYWDRHAEKNPGYEPSPTAGDSHDKYYDDNAWMVLTFCEAYELTRDARYLNRARQTLAFVLTGWDEQAGGGIWWHEQHKDGSKNTCVNAPAALGCLRLAQFEDADRAKQLTAQAQKLIDWTTRTLQDPHDGLYHDRITVATGQVIRGKLTYNTGLMIRASLAMYRASGNDAFLHEAQRSARACDWFLDKQTGAYSDSVKFSHLLVEADLDLYRTTHEPYLLHRAQQNAVYWYQHWKQSPPPTLIDNASIARMLWLMADAERSEK